MTRFTKNQKVRIIGHKEFLVGQFGVVAGLGAGLVWVRTDTGLWPLRPQFVEEADK